MLVPTFNVNQEGTISRRELEEINEQHKSKGPLAKLASALLCDTARNIIDPQDTYHDINEYCRRWVKDKEVIDFWFSVYHSDL